MLVESLFKMLYPSVGKNTELGYLGWVNKWLAGDIPQQSQFIESNTRYLLAVPSPTRSADPLEAPIRNALYKATEPASLYRPDGIDSNFMQRRTDIVLQMACSSNSGAILGGIGRISAEYNRSENIFSSYDVEQMPSTLNDPVLTISGVTADLGYATIGRSSGFIEFKDDECTITDAQYGVTVVHEVSPLMRDPGGYIISEQPLLIPNTPSLSLEGVYTEDTSWSYEIHYRPKVSVDAIASAMPDSALYGLLAKLESEKLPPDVLQAVQRVKLLIAPTGSTKLFQDIDRILAAVTALCVSSALRF